MADEKQPVVSDIDDWLDDLDDSNEFSGELDQENIDALLGNGPGLGDKAELPSGAPEEEHGPAELDQGSIDALLSGITDLEQNEPVAVEAAPSGEQKVVELDQHNIDALFDTDAVLEKAAANKGSEALGGDDPNSLDQNSIDALLRGSLDLGNGEIAPATASAEDTAAGLEQDNIDALFDNNAGFEKAEASEGAEALSGDAPSGLAQDNIDALLRSSLDLEDGAAAESQEGAGELNQADIDALLGGQDVGSGALSAPPAGAQGAAGNEDAGSSDIDLLLGGGDDTSGLTPPAPEKIELDQDNIDALLGASNNEAAPPPAPPTSFPISGAKPDDAPGTIGTLDVDQDEIDQLFSGLDDDLAEPFPQAAAMPAEAGGSLGDLRQVEEELMNAAAATIPGDATIAADPDTRADNAGDGDSQLPKGNFLPLMPGAFKKIAAAVITVCLVLLIGLSLTFLRSGKNKPPAIAPPEQKPVAQAQVKEPPAQQAPPANSLPVVSDSAYRMPEIGGEVVVALTAKDNDNDPLAFSVITPPLHGRLSGTPPVLTYLPNQDFPGQDKFEYQAQDGKGSSGPATVTIIGPNLAKVAAEREKAEAGAEQKSAKQVQPVQSAVLARNLTFATTNTGVVPIKWGRIWRAANRIPYSSKVSVEISGSPLHGTLSKINADHYCYRPDPTFTGTDVIVYRFRQSGLSSKAGKLTMRVSEGNLAPEIHIREMADAYLVGETVVIDASATRDDARSSLTFNWEQLAGVTVRMKKSNSEGSVVSFAMPSGFINSGADSGPVLRITVIDALGKSASRDIRLHSISRRKSPLWGVPGGRVAGSASDRLL